jgi:hypothetical protein
MNNVEAEQNGGSLVVKVCFSTDDALAVACPSFDKDRLTPCISNL